MFLLIVKYAVTSLIVVAVSEIAKRADKLGAVVASLPLTTVLVMVWLHLENQPAAKISNHAYYTFWYVIPTLPMFLAFPALMSRGVGFWPSLGLGCALTLVCLIVTALVMRHFHVDLLP